MLVLPSPQRGVARISRGLLIGLATLVVLGGILAGASLLLHLPANSTGKNAPPPVVRGGTWVDDVVPDASSLIPGADGIITALDIDQALYLPLFYGDAQGRIQAGAARELPTVQNGGISPDAKIWTFHMRSGLEWSDGQPYNARDIDYSWRIWQNPSFAVASFPVWSMIESTVISSDNLSITFHLKQPYVPFLQFWTDGLFAPLPAHHFNGMTAEQILNSPENLNPKVTNGPFMMSESKPSDHYTLIRNPKYYLAQEGLPYLSKMIWRIVSHDAILSDLQAGTIDSSLWLDVTQLQNYEKLQNYKIVTASTDAEAEILFFNFHNIILSDHHEVREAIARAIDYNTLITSIPQGLAHSLCTDHGSFYHPGFEPSAGCPVYDPQLANQLLDNSGWVRGPDGIRQKDHQRLEFDYATNTMGILTSWRFAGEAILQKDLLAIGIKIDIENYPLDTLDAIMSAGKASPPTGAVAGRFDMIELATDPSYDPDDSSLLSCAHGPNFEFYCNSALDLLYQQEVKTLDTSQRQQIFNQIHAIYLTDWPFVTLYSPPMIYIVSKRAHNYQPSPVSGESPNNWDLWCDHGTC